MKLKTTNIKGKEYVEVNERIKAFRSMEQFSGHCLVTEIVEVTQDTCTLMAKIYDASDRLIATGLAHELKNAGMVNKTSHIENCETSAWGRALGNLGIGVDSSVASFEEVSMAIAGQEGGSKIEELRAAATRSAQDAGKLDDTRMKWIAGTSDAAKLEEAIRAWENDAISDGIKF